MQSGTAKSLQDKKLAQEQMPFRAFKLPELRAQPPLEWLVDGILPEKGLIVLYGTPGAGKTFLALDLAFSVASGRPWLDRSVRAGGVVYIAAEGWYSIARRLDAWKACYGQEDPEQFLVIPEGVQFTGLTGAKNFGRLLSTVEKGGMRFTEISMQEYLDFDPVTEDVVSALDHEETIINPSLVVIDTMSRCMVGADENSAEDMSKFVDNVDLLRRVMDCTVVIVHHTGKNGYVERGSSVLRGAADTMMRIVSQPVARGRISLVCEKQKDHAPFEDISLFPEPVLDSLVYRRQAEGLVLKQRLSVRDCAALEVLHAEAAGLNLTDWSKACGITLSAMQHIAAKLLKVSPTIVTRDEAKVYRLTAVGTEKILEHIVEEGSAFAAPAKEDGPADGNTQV